MASRKRITSHKKSRQKKEFRGIAQRRDPEFRGIAEPKRLRDPLAFEDLTKETTPTVLPKSKPKRPVAKKKSSGVTFDTSGTLPGKTIKGKKYGGVMMKARGGTFKGTF
jgi:hypothetical protein